MFACVVRQYVWKSSTDMPGFRLKNTTILTIRIPLFDWKFLVLSLLRFRCLLRFQLLRQGVELTRSLFEWSASASSLAAAASARWALSSDR
jgi:hypothetical protein